MLVAEIRHKLERIEDIEPGPESLARVRAILRETSEDLLTADVFGTLKYLPRRPFLESILKAIIDANPQAAGFRAALDTMLDDELRFDFWPSLGTPADVGRGSTEPDLVISGSRSYIVVEAKLGSYFGDTQIERELSLALDEARDRSAFLWLITRGVRGRRLGPKHRNFNVEQYVDWCRAEGRLTLERAKQLKANANRILWLDWAGILLGLKQAAFTPRPPGSEVDRHCAAMVQDLLAVADARGLRPFEGIGRASRAEVAPLPRPILLTKGPGLASILSALEFNGFHSVPSERAFRWQCPSQALTFVGFRTHAQAIPTGAAAFAVARR